MALFYQSPTRNLPDGYTFCGATLKDIPVIIYLLNQRQMSNPNAGNLNFDEMRKIWQTSQINPALDVRLVFDRREQLTGYIEVWTNNELASQPWLWGCVHPAYEGRGIGTTLLRWAEARVRLALEILPKNLRVAARFGILSTLDKAPSLCQGLGWQLLCQPQTNKPGAMPGLIQKTSLPVNSAYDIYEKVIRSADELIQQVD